MTMTEHLRKQVEEYARARHNQVVSVEIVGYKVKEDRDFYGYNSCQCSTTWTKSLEVEYEYTTKRGRVGKGNYSITDDEVWEIAEQEVRELMK